MNILNFENTQIMVWSIQEMFYFFFNKLFSMEGDLFVLKANVFNQKSETYALLDFLHNRC